MNILNIPKYSLGMSSGHINANIVLEQKLSSGKTIYYVRTRTWYDYIGIVYDEEGYLMTTLVGIPTENGMFNNFQYYFPIDYIL